MLGSKLPQTFTIDRSPASRSTRALPWTPQVDSRRQRALLIKPCKVSGVQTVTQHSDPAEVDTLSMEQMTTLLSKIVRKGQQPSKDWLDSYRDRAFHRLRNCKPGQLAAIIRGFTSLNYNPGTDFVDFFDETCTSHPGPFDSESTTEVLTSLTALPQDTELRFPATAARRIRRQMDQFTYQQLSSALRALNHFDVPLDDAFTTEVGERMGRCLASMDPEELEATLQAELQHCMENSDGDGSECLMPWATPAGMALEMSAEQEQALAAHAQQELAANRAGGAMGAASISASVHRTAAPALAYAP